MTYFPPQIVRFCTMEGIKTCLSFLVVIYVLDTKKQSIRANIHLLCTLLDETYSIVQKGHKRKPEQVNRDY